MFNDYASCKEHFRIEGNFKTHVWEMDAMRWAEVYGRLFGYLLEGREGMTSEEVKESYVWYHEVFRTMVEGGQIKNFLMEAVRTMNLNCKFFIDCRELWWD